MQSSTQARPATNPTSLTAPRHLAPGARAERAAEESPRPAVVALEPHWAAAIDAATD